MTEHRGIPGQTLVESELDVHTNLGRVAVTGMQYEDWAACLCWPFRLYQWCHSQAFGKLGTMAAERKLKAEIDRTLKKVIEGQEVFDELWKQARGVGCNYGVPFLRVTRIMASMTLRCTTARTAIRGRNSKAS